MNEMANVRMQAYAQAVKQIMKQHEERPGKAASEAGKPVKRGLGTGGGCLR